MKFDKNLFLISKRNKKIKKELNVAKNIIEVLEDRVDLLDKEASAYFSFIKELGKAKNVCKI